MDVLREVDVYSVLPAVRCPTLVLQREDRGPDVARRIAASIPDAHVALFKGGSAAPYLEDGEEVWAVIAEFLGDRIPLHQEPVSGPIASAMTAIFFADIAESTALTERLGDATFREEARALDTALRGVIRANGGTPIEGKLLGDGVLAVFTSARQAIQSAMACGRAGGEAGLPLHLGLHAGDVIREDDNVYGGAVNVAARIAAASAPGELLVSQTVRDLARTSAGVAFEDRGQRTLKGIEGRQRLFAVRWRDEDA